MIIANTRIKDMLPAHYRDYYPRFITFLEKYYEWLYRSSGMSDSEVNDLRNDTSWLENDIDKFISTGSIRYLNPSDPAVVESNIVKLNNVANPGDISGRLSENTTLDESFDGYLTAEGTPFTDANSVTVELRTVENKILDSWFNSMGLDTDKRELMGSLKDLDQVLLLSLLKHIYAIKGTEKSIKLFFSLVFGEDVTVYYPKGDVAVIDDNFILDDVKVIRDDELYQEYSYVIEVANDPSNYLRIFEAVYIPTIHPSGFRVELRKKS